MNLLKTVTKKGLRQSPFCSVPCAPLFESVVYAMHTWQHLNPKCMVACCCLLDPVLGAVSEDSGLLGVESPGLLLLGSVAQR